MTELTPELIAELRGEIRPALELAHRLSQRTSEYVEGFAVSPADHEALDATGTLGLFAQHMPALLDAAERGLKAEVMISRHHELCNETIRNLRLLSNKCREDVADAIHAAARPLCYIGDDPEESSDV